MAALTCNAQQKLACQDDGWPMQWRMPSLEDVSEYFQKNVLKNQAQEGSRLEEVMSRQIICVTEGIALEQLSNTFKKVSGVCVVDDEKRLIGVVSRKDLDREGTTVREVMSSPPVACKADATVRDAAALMLKHKVHRIPVVDSQAQVIGMVTRTDIFTALEAGH
ncbi:hypothetical protein OEZ86_005899 [Tetradesmus obliquus]|uniref:CBS domain-containing protein n=1 Tax=Tetradesmus obliquus TaxID=3088 RepID=A0A383WHS5_TETOB|nr:hypothetical protein OEZ86_005899 [Tetradesmus obliquus]|eukprot:jgi/Sobl393_1/6255/SZX77008.1